MAAGKADVFVKPVRHPEFISGSVHQLRSSDLWDRWMLKQVQHDEQGGRLF